MAFCTDTACKQNHLILPARKRPDVLWRRWTLCDQIAKLQWTVLSRITSGQTDLILYRISFCWFYEDSPNTFLACFYLWRFRRDVVGIDKLERAHLICLSLSTCEVCLVCLQLFTQALVYSSQVPAFPVAQLYVCFSYL